jgi:hypothetical protein
MLRVGENSCRVGGIKTEQRVGSRESIKGLRADDAQRWQSQCPDEGSVTGPT